MDTRLHAQTYIACDKGFKQRTHTSTWLESVTTGSGKVICCVWQYSFSIELASKLDACEDPEDPSLEPWLASSLGCRLASPAGTASGSAILF